MKARTPLAPHLHTARRSALPLPRRPPLSVSLSAPPLLSLFSLVYLLSSSLVRSRANLSSCLHIRRVLPPLTCPPLARGRPPYTLSGSEGFETHNPIAAPTPLSSLLSGVTSLSRMNRAPPNAGLLTAVWILRCAFSLGRGLSPRLIRHLLPSPLLPPSRCPPPIHPRSPQTRVTLSLYFLPNV